MNINIVSIDPTLETNWSRWTKMEFEPKFHQFWFESVDVHFWYDFAENYLKGLLLLAITLYLGIVYWLNHFMRNKNPYQLREAMFCWNVFVGALSIIALQRVSSEVLFLIMEPKGFYGSVCLRDGLHMSTAWWAILLVILKPLFMFDTIFLILRKKPVDAMHLIHHIVAIIAAPLLLQFSEPLMRWIGFANLLVHSIDYPLLALKISVPKSRHIMAALEVGQMIFVLLTSAYTLVLQGQGTLCLRHPTSILFTYGIYLGLLLVVGGTLLTPTYWKRSGSRKVKSS